MNESDTSRPTCAGALGPEDPEPEPSRPDRDDPDGRGPAAELILHASEPDPPVSGWMEPRLLRVLREAGCDDARLSVIVVGDDEMSELHQRYAQQPGTTDVLTFDQRETQGDPVEGDIFICVDEAARQAARRGHDTRVELLLYAVHGLLHLLGEDDHTEAGYQRMHQREDELLRAIGVGAVFARPGPGSDAEQEHAS